MSDRERIVITGVGCVSSVGENAEATYAAMLRGERGIRNEREWLVEQVPPAYLPTGKEKLRSHLAARVLNFDLLQDPAFANRMDQRYIDRFLSRSAELAFKASAEALRAAGVVTEMLELDAVDPERFAFVIGTGIGGGIEVGKLRAEMERGKGISATGMNRAQPDNATVMAAMFYGAKGPSATLTAACASGNVAISDAVRRLERDEADVIAVGGTEGLDATIIASFERTGAASQSEDPASASRPFAASPGQAVLSEGAGFLVLEKEKHARARGAAILGIVAGFGETNDAFDPTLLSGEGIVRAMQLALAKSGISGQDRLYLSAHATATAKGDVQEAKAIHQIFTEEDRGPDQVKNSVSSIKGFTGHAVGGANAVQAVISTMILNKGKQPPAPWLDEVLEGMEDYVSPKDKITEAEIDAVLSNGMGFGGQNSSIVIKKYEN